MLGLAAEELESAPLPLRVGIASVVGNKIHSSISKQVELRGAWLKCILAFLTHLGLEEVQMLRVVSVRIIWFIIQEGGN